MQFKKIAALLAGITVAWAATANSAERADASEYERWDPTDKRFYVAPMASYSDFDEDTYDTDDAFGGTLALGKTFTKYLALELYGFHFNGADSQINSNEVEDIDATGYGVSALFFPIRDIFPVFGVAGIGQGEYEFNGGVLDEGEQDADFVDIGVGFLAPLADMGVDNRYDIAIRGEVRWRSYDVESDFSDKEYQFRSYVASLGLQIPLGAKAEPPPPPAPEPVAVPVPVPVPAPPVDSDGDGVPDNRDQCPGSPPGTQVDANGCPVQKEEPIVLKGVNFEYDSARLTSQAQNRLDNVVNALAASQQIRVRVEGHTDSKGSASYNLTLSRERAASVVSYLVSHGIDRSRLQSEGYGETRPIAPNTKPSGADNPAGRAQNRRVELHVIEQ
jgi:OOP family OmpA-OmpF porin